MILKKSQEGLEMRAIMQRQQEMSNQKSKRTLNATESEINIANT